MYGDEIPIENPRIFHAHAMDTQQVMRLGIEKRRIELVMRLDVLLGKDGATGRHPAYERQSHLLAQGVLELDAPRGARHELEYPFLL